MAYEILVHISAPTTKEGDDLYRNEALAYRNFRCSRKLFLDERDSDHTSPAFQHPRNHVLQTEQTGDAHGSSLRNLGLDSFSVTELDSSDEVVGPLETQVIIDTQQAIGAFDSQISTITNSFYDGASLSWAEQRPAKRPRTAEPVLDSFSSRRAAPLASDPPSAYKSPYALNLSFSGLDPISSLLPESYGLSKSGGSNSIHLPEETANSPSLTTFPATPHMSRHNFGGTYHTPEDNDAVAFVLSSRGGGSPAFSINSVSNSPSRATSFKDERSRGLFLNILIAPVQQISTPDRRTTTGSLDSTQQQVMRRESGRTPSPHLDVVQNGSLRHKDLPDQIHSRTGQRAEAEATHTVSQLGTNSRHFVPDSPRDQLARSRSNTALQGLHLEPHVTQVCETPNGHEVRDRQHLDDTSQNGGSSIFDEHIEVNGGTYFIRRPRCSMRNIQLTSESLHEEAFSCAK